MTCSEWVVSELTYFSYGFTKFENSRFIRSAKQTRDNRRNKAKAKTVGRALLILRPIPSPIRPIPSSFRPIPSSIRPIPTPIRPITRPIQPIPSLIRPNRSWLFKWMKWLVIVSSMMNEMSFQRISNIFSEFSFERDRRMDRWTEPLILSWKK